MNHLTYVNWCVTGLEGLVTMLKTMDEDHVPITEEMAQRYLAAADKVQKYATQALDRIENKS